MAGSFTAMGLDNLPDNTLKIIHTLSTYLVSETTDALTDYQKHVLEQDFAPAELGEFCKDVSAAMDRRFGPVPGY